MGAEESMLSRLATVALAFSLLLYEFPVKQQDWIQSPGPLAGCTATEVWDFSMSSIFCVDFSLGQTKAPLFFLSLKVLEKVQIFQNCIHNARWKYSD